MYYSYAVSYEGVDCHIYDIYKWDDATNNYLKTQRFYIKDSDTNGYKAEWVESTKELFYKNGKSLRLNPETALFEDTTNTFNFVPGYHIDSYGSRFVTDNLYLQDMIAYSAVVYKNLSGVWTNLYTPAYSDRVQYMDGVIFVSHGSSAGGGAVDVYTWDDVNRVPTKISSTGSSFPVGQIRKYNDQWYRTSGKYIYYLKLKDDKTGIVTTSSKQLILTGDSSYSIDSSNAKFVEYGGTTRFVAPPGTYSDVCRVFDVGNYNKQITFSTPPSKGATVTATYHTPYIHKTKDYVLDVGFSIQFGEGVV